MCFHILTWVNPHAKLTLCPYSHYGGHSSFYAHLSSAVIVKNLLPLLLWGLMQLALKPKDKTHRASGLSGWSRALFRPRSTGVGLGLLA